MTDNSVILDPTVKLSDDARIFGSCRGTVIRIGAFSEIYEFVVIKAVGGMGDVVIGEHCYINPGSVIYSGNGVTLGNYVLIAANVALMPTNHSFASRSVEMRKQGFAESKGGITIEDDVWIGANCTVLDGARIGRGAIVAAGSVVKGHIPPYEIWGGVPAEKIGERD